MAKPATQSILISSTKINAVMELLRKSPKGVKSCIFSQWTGMLDLVQCRLNQEGIRSCRLDGTMKREEREECIQAFSDPWSNIEVMLVSLKCGAFGLNLTAASQVFILDPWWNR